MNEGAPNVAPTRAPSRQRTPHERVVRALAALLVVLLALLAVRLWAIDLFQIVSASMEPTLLAANGDRPADTIVLNRLAYLWSAPARWDVVVFTSTDESGRPVSVVKRVVGLPGELIEIEEGHVTVNGRRVDPPGDLGAIEYTRTGAFAAAPVLLGDERYFVLGDNSYPSIDSRRFGPIERATILGRAAWILWPRARAGAIR